MKEGMFGICKSCKEILQARALFEGQSCGKPQRSFLEIWYSISK